jgi:hypothetical protein
MKKPMAILAGVLMFMLPTMSKADSPSGIVAHTIGTFTADFACAATGCAGDIISCPVGEAILKAKIRFLYMEDICDDDGSTPCGEQLTGLVEDCLNPSTGLNIAGAIASLTLQGKVRVCFDDTAPLSDCTGNPPTGSIVAEGVSRLQARQLLAAGGAPVNAPSQNSDEITLTKASGFTINGKKVRLRTSRAVYQATGQPDVNGDNCGGSCGFAGTAVSAGHK